MALASRITVAKVRSGLAALTILVTCTAVTARAQSDVVDSSDGVRIAYEVHGESSPALVLVHGWSCDRRYWDGQVEPLSKSYKVVTVDLAGHGESGLGRDAWTMAAFGADVASVVEKLDLKSVILIGHSMGGDVIMEAARRLPGRVVGLVWVDTYRKLGSSRSDQQAEALVRPFREDFAGTTNSFVRSMFRIDADKQLVEQVAEDMSAAPPTVALGALASALTYDREIPPALSELKLPVFALNADYQPTDVESLERHGVEVVTMLQTGHFLMMEDPERFNALLIKVIHKLMQ